MIAETLGAAGAPVGNRVQYDAPQIPYASGFVNELTRYRQAMHMMDVHLADEGTVAAYEGKLAGVERARASKGAQIMSPPRAVRSQVINETTGSDSVPMVTSEFTPDKYR